MPLLEVCDGCSAMRCFAGKVSRRVGVGLCVMRVWPRKHTMLGFLQYFPCEVRSDCKNIFFVCRSCRLALCKVFPNKCECLQCLCSSSVLTFTAPAPGVWAVFPDSTSLLIFSFMAQLFQGVICHSDVGTCSWVLLVAQLIWTV